VSDTLRFSAGGRTALADGRSGLSGVRPIGPHCVLPDTVRRCLTPIGRCLTLSAVPVS